MATDTAHVQPNDTSTSSLNQNTYTNAEKLLQAAEELAHTGECNPEEIYNVAQTLDTHIARFATRVQKRHRLLNMAILFYTHEKEVRLK